MSSIEGSSIVYSEYVRGDRLVVDDLGEADYAYAEKLNCFEVRKKGERLGRFDDWNNVVEFLSGEDRNL